MWKIKGSRTNSAQVSTLLENNAFILAELDGQVIGAVNVNLMAADTGEFGMLVAILEESGTGIGTALVRAAEEWALAKGCKTMRLELLTPRHWKHPSKEFLKAWYSRIGYVPQSIEPFEILHPEKVSELVTDCDFTVWLKSFELP